MSDLSDRSDDERWADRSRYIRCPCNDRDPKKCKYANPGKATQFPCPCVCHYWKNLGVRP